MRVPLRGWIVWVGIACAANASAAPEKALPAPLRESSPAASTRGTRTHYEAAATQYSSGNHEQALAEIEQGLAVAPKDLKLLSLKGTVLLELRDYAGALAAFRVYLEAGPRGPDRRRARKLIGHLLASESTFLETSVGNASAEVYLDSMALGVFCRAAPVCRRALLPGEYKVIVERSGFERWTGRIQVARGKVAPLAVTLAEKPSLLAVRVAPEGASVTVDGGAHDPSRPIAAGTHRVVVSLPGHAEERREVVAREGKPIELDVALSSMVPVQVEPLGAELLLGGTPIAVWDGRIAVPPGAHVLVARAPGFQDGKIAIPTERDAGYKLAIKLARAAAAAPRPELVATAVTTVPAPGGLTGRRKLALVAGGFGVAALGAGVVLGLQSGRLEDSAYALCESLSSPCQDAPEANRLLERGRSLALQANVAYGIAGGAAIAAAVLWLTGAPEARVAVTPRLAGTAAGLDLSVRF